MPATDPLVLWLTGGPGCSSELAVFLENGPYKLDQAGEVLSLNPYSWHLAANMLYVDNPIGTGYSNAVKDSDLDSTEFEVANDFHEFMVKYLESFPAFKGRDFYITGESYAGHYIPAIAAKILASTDISVNFKGIAIGNGWVDPVRQYPEYITYASTYGLIP